MTQLYEEERAEYLKHLDVTKDSAESGFGHALATTPLFSLRVKYPQDDSKKDSKSSRQYEANSDTLPQHSLLGFHVGEHPSIDQKEPIMLNTRAPNSVFLCGSQGSGKSFTLGCILENHLLPDARYGRLETPVAGIAFHYDTDAGSAAEVASLCSRGIEVNVLVSSSNYEVLNEAYQKLATEVGGHITVDRLLLKDRDLNIGRMHKLMAFDESADNVPLYVAVIHNELRRMSINNEPFSMRALEQKLEGTNFAPGQRNMLDMRLALLRSFMANNASKKHRSGRELFKIKPATLTIVDLSDPFIDTSMVCTLFDICLGLFMENKPKDGLIVTLDEAHKYLNTSTGTTNFTEHLITTIRMQRHHATRVVIATQEPTISGRLLDLCNTSIVHRFTSPAWFEAIKGHLGGASSLVASPAEHKAMFESIVSLGTGESFVFSPFSFLCYSDGKEQPLGTNVMKMKTRKREGKDLGRSKMAGEKSGMDEMRSLVEGIDAVEI
jgi:hypothetical protein